MCDLAILLELATSVALDAGQAIETDGEMYRNVEQDLERDVKIKADRELESIIVKRLLRETQYPVLSEESGYLGGMKTSQGYYWIVDPLDGSLNFSRGIPINCISIALWEKMDPKLGVVYDFNRGELFSGLVGEGAWLNGKPIKVSEISEKSRAVLFTGFPVSTDFSRNSLLDFVQNVKLYKKIRLLGSAALSLAYVASGKGDAYIENDIKLWDVAAGIGLVKAAGGRVECIPSRGGNVFKVWAGNQNIVALGTGR